MQKASRFVVHSVTTKVLQVKHLKVLFQTVETKVERNIKIIEAVDLGYSQNQIAKILGVIQGVASHVLRQNQVNNYMGNDP